MLQSQENEKKFENKIPRRVPQGLRVVLEAIDRMCKENSQHTSSDQFIQLLQTLDCNEKSIIADYFCKLLWNISSVKVLGCLNRLRILTAAEYILSQTDDEHIQLVLNDFLETEFDLLANLIICGHYDLMSGSRITECIDEGLRRLFADLKNDPKLNHFEYLAALKQSLPKDLHAKFVNNHIKIILSMYPNSTQNAFAKFSSWITPILDQNELTLNFYKTAVAAGDTNIVNTILNISADAQFKGWRNYLCLLASIIKYSPQHCAYIKRWLKDRLKAVVESASVEIMAHVLLSIRVVCLFENDQVDNYTKWYKQNIGDMKFVFNLDEFKTMMSVLTQLVPYEADQHYLEVHVKTSISPPVMCSQICRDYKQLCRTRIADILDNSDIIEIDEDLFPEGV